MNAARVVARLARLGGSSNKLDSPREIAALQQQQQQQLQLQSQQPESSQQLQ